MGRRCPIDGLLITFLVSVPKKSLLQIAGRKLPVFFLQLQTAQQTQPLFLLGQMQKEFKDNSFIFCDMTFKIIDLAKTFIPKFLIDIGNGIDSRNMFPHNIFRMHPCYQYVLIMGTVKYPELSLGRERNIMSP